MVETMVVERADTIQLEPLPVLGEMLEMRELDAMPSRLGNHPRLSAALLNTPWLIQQGWLEALYAIADGSMVDLTALPGAARSEAWRRGDVLALERHPGSRMAGSRLTTVRDGIATLHVTGPIIRYADMFSEMSGAVSLASISADFNRALADQSVKGILLAIDSPGGEAASIDEFASMITAAREVKPIHAYTGDLMASAAYWIGSAASQITASRTASLGSIGTVAIMPRKDASGYIEIVSTQSPRKRMDPESEEGHQAIQEHVDGLTEIFVEAVASNRGVTVEKVSQDFGKGGILLGKQAVKAGLADKVGSYEGAFQALLRETERKPKMTTSQATAERPEVEASEETPVVESATVAAGTDDRDSLLAQIASLQSENAILAGEKTREIKAAITARITGKIKAEGWAGADADNLLVAQSLIDHCGGEEGAAYQAFGRSMLASANQEIVAKLGTPAGVGGVETAATPVQELEMRAKALIAEDKTLSFDTACATVFKNDREFEKVYGEYASKHNASKRGQ